MTFKFEVGQYLQLAHENNPLGEDKTAIYMVIERQLQECPAGIQIWYSCRGHYRKWREPRSVSIQLIKFNEIELAETKIEDTKTATDDVKEKLIKLLAQIESQEQGGKPMD